LKKLTTFFSSEIIFAVKNVFLLFFGSYFFLEKILPTFKVAPNFSKRLCVTSLQVSGVGAVLQ